MSGDTDRDSMKGIIAELRRGVGYTADLPDRLEAALAEGKEGRGVYDELNDTRVTDTILKFYGALNTVRDILAGAVNDFEGGVNSGDGKIECIRFGLSIGKVLSVLDGVLESHVKGKRVLIGGEGEKHE